MTKKANASTPPGKAANSANNLAVALDDQDGLGPTKVVATGRGFVADQIMQTAFENGVKVRKDADLVQVLTALELEEEIPAEAISAVSEILHYVYQANHTFKAEETEDDT